MEQNMNYQWYPGHMTKARRMMEENIKLIDLVIELVDARIPLSSRNPDIDGLAKNKARIILLNKSDLSDERKNVMWIDYFTKKGFYVLKLNSKSGAGVKQVNQTIVLACKEKIERDKRKGILNRPVRAMVVGIPNVGKSTLMNVLVGERISIATFKAQTTRHRIMGIYNTDEMQIVFSDTPGVLKPNYKLQESMLNFSTSALTDADILLYVTDVVETPDKNNEFMAKVRQMTVPVLLLINKIDLTDQEKLVKLVEDWKELLPQAEIIPISAASKFNVDYVMKRIKELLPDSPPYFGKDQWTDKPARFFVNEIIREKILLYYDKEIPYSVEVAVEEFKEEAKKIHIRAVIYVERESQKGIIIGKQGKALKKVATEARRELERFFGKTIFLETYVKVDKDWRSSDKELRNFGYQLD